jgi:hypothetical protein
MAINDDDMNLADGDGAMIKIVSPFPFTTQPDVTDTRRTQSNLSKKRVSLDISHDVSLEVWVTLLTNQ